MHRNLRQQKVLSDFKLDFDNSLKELFLPSRYKKINWTYSSAG
jgi:hypothetical protein